MPGDPRFRPYTDNAAAGENYGMEATLQAACRPLLLDLRAALLERYNDYVFGDRNLDGREQAHAPQYQYDLGVEYHGARRIRTR